jgi:hypothetical protein
VQNSIFERLSGSYRAGLSLTLVAAGIALLLNASAKTNGRGGVAWVRHNVVPPRLGADIRISFLCACVLCRTFSGDFTSLEGLEIVWRDPPQEFEAARRVALGPNGSASNAHPASHEPSEEAFWDDVIASSRVPPFSLGGSLQSHRLSTAGGFPLAAFGFFGFISLVRQRKPGSQTKAEAALL